ncbi:MAG: chemotaxis protein CheB [Mariniblastus sp.]
MSITPAFDSNQPEHLASSTESNKSSLRFVVGIGASAGGILSLERLLTSLGPTTGSAAFVVVQHMSPEIESSMEAILQRFTTMKVVAVEDGVQLEPDTVYLIQPAEEIRLDGLCLAVTDLDREQIPRPIDTFFQSLGEGGGDRAIGMVLSGTGSDGAEGIATIHQHGGTTIVESLETAQFDGMPKNAINKECIDMVLSPEEIGKWLTEQFSDPANKTEPIEKLNQAELSGVKLIFSLLAERHEIDFSCYKPETVARRIERRQQMNRSKSILDYAELLRGDNEELDLLYHDLLIGVTKFFRDTEAFERLAKHLNEQIQSLSKGEEFRVWVAGCATGEEPYSIAMLCHEAFDLAGKPACFKIFATDIHGGSLEHASRGVYDQDSMEFVGIERQQKYFEREGMERFQVGSILRRHLVFARHNVVQDPPFTKMDLVTCRNLLIYLRSDAQTQAISSFHFALKRGGIMMMGASESPGRLSEEFDVVDDVWKFYSKIRNLPMKSRGGKLDLMQAAMARPRRLVNLLNSDRPETLSFTGLIEGYDLILGEFVTSGILLDERRNVLHIFGNANRYLKSTSGRFTGSITGFLQGDAKVSIVAALIRTGKEPGRQIVLEDLNLPVGDGFEVTDVLVKALKGHSSEKYVWFIVFEPKPDVEKSDDDEVGDEVRGNLPNDAYAAMESELMYTKESLSATIEQVETSNEELQASNEQLVAANEELQSTNEELHSVNEELYSVNAENQRKILALEEITDDVDNLLASTDIGTIFLDDELHIRKFTLAAANYVKLLPSDIGRDITDFALHIDLPQFFEKIKEVFETSEPFSEHATAKNLSRVLVRVTPYFSQKKIKGAIVNFIEMGEVSLN